MKDLAQWVIDQQKPLDKTPYLDGWNKNLLRDFDYSLP
jgi:hypothetical protein